MTNTNSDRPRNTNPPGDRFGSNSGRRVIIGSMSNRSRKNPPTPSSQT